MDEKVKDSSGHSLSDIYERKRRKSSVVDPLGGRDSTGIRRQSTTELQRHDLHLDSRRLSSVTVTGNAEGVMVY